jgi:hypothetical protein
MEDFIDVVHRSLDGTDLPGGVRCFYLHGLRLPEPLESEGGLES